MDNIHVDFQNDLEADLMVSRFPVDEYHLLSEICLMDLEAMIAVNVDLPVSID